MFMVNSRLSAPRKAFATTSDISETKHLSSELFKRTSPGILRGFITSTTVSSFESDFIERGCINKFLVIDDGICKRGT